VTYKWKPASGTWDIAKESLAQNVPDGITRCYVNIGFTSYIVSFRMKLTTHTEPHAGEAKFLYSGADKDEDYRIDFIHQAPGICRVSIAKVQFAALLQLSEGQTCAVKIVLKENLLSVFVDQMLIISELNLGRRSDGKIAFGTWMSTVEYTNIDIRPFKRVKCFIVMPFDQKRNFLYETVIKPTLELHPSIVFDFMRADEPLTTGKITDEITEFIEGSEFIIADVSSTNPNVYYELGFAHARSKKAILLFERVEGQKLILPFDIQDFRCHAYTFSKDGFDIIKQKLSDIIRRITS
jgi:hypothetical protein